MNIQPIANVAPAFYSIVLTVKLTDSYQTYPKRGQAELMIKIEELVDYEVDKCRSKSTESHHILFNSLEMYKLSDAWRGINPSLQYRFDRVAKI